MFSGGKGQVGAVTVVLLTGITVGVASVVYVWGQPLLDKRESGNQLDDAERKVLDIRDQVITVDGSGPDSTAEISLDIQNDEYSTNLVRLNSSSNYIEFVVEGGEFPYPKDSWTLLDGQNMRNLSITGGDYVIEGEDKEGVVVVKADSQVATYRIEFRNIFSETDEIPLEKINLKERGSTVTGSGTLYLRNDGDRVESGADGLTVSSGQTFDREVTDVEVEMR